MICPRCGRSMRFEEIYAESSWIGCFLCLICGECLDEVILENRQESLAKVKIRLRNIVTPESVRDKAIEMPGEPC